MLKTLTYRGHYLKVRQYLDTGTWAVSYWPVSADEKEDGVYSGGYGSKDLALGLAKDRIDEHHNDLEQLGIETQTWEEFIETDAWSNLIESAAQATDYFNGDELEEFSRTWNGEKHSSGGRMLLQIPQKVETIESDAAYPVIMFEIVLPSHARVTDLNRYVVVPGDGKFYRIFEALEIRNELHNERGIRTHTRYQAKGVQVIP